MSDFEQLVDELAAVQRAKREKQDAIGEFYAGQRKAQAAEHARARAKSRSMLEMAKALGQQSETAMPRRSHADVDQEADEAMAKLHALIRDKKVMPESAAKFEMAISRKRDQCHAEIDAFDSPDDQAAAPGPGMMSKALTMAMQPIAAARSRVGLLNAMLLNAGSL